VESADPDRPVAGTGADGAFVALFSESAARALVTVEDDRVPALESLAREHGVPLIPLGRTGGDALVLSGAAANGEAPPLVEIGLEELRSAWTATLPAALA
jgi:phosphoribosylformylglycinamidine synthase